jgi:Mg2+ and Co2+ transporter CorA
MPGLIIDAEGRVHPLDDAAPGEGLRWLDLVREEPGCEELLNRVLTARVHDRHLADLRNAMHPPFYDGTAEYDLLIVRSLDTRTPPDDPETRAIAFLVTRDAVVSVRAADDPTLAPVRERLLDSPRRPPANAGALLHLLLNQVVDGLLGLRDPLSQRLADLQERLLDPNDPFDDWRPLMRLRSRLRWLAGRMEGQRSALVEWREQTVLAIDEGLAIRFNDLEEHIRRVQHQADVLQHDIDGLVNIHFAASSQNTNRVMQFLAVVSAIFLPLNLIAGIFGMNFQDMPLLHLPWAGWAIIAAMPGLGVLLWWWFRRRRWM